MLDELHALVTSKRGDLLSLGLARLWRLAPQMRAIGLSATVAEPESLARFLVPQRDGDSEAADIVVAGGAAAPVVEMLDTARAAALGRPLRAPRARRDLRPDPAQQDHAGVRQHPQPGRDAVPGAVAHERRRPGDRAASRLARRRPAPQGRGGDGGGQAARRGLHLLARSRHRLGRCRSRHQCRRAQGRLAADAAHRPRQSPPRRSLARRAGAGQPLRGAGMRASRSRRSRRTPRTRRRCAPARSTCWRSTCWAAPAASRFCPTSSTTKCGPPRPMPAWRATDFDDVVDFVATGGYALKSLRALRAHQAGQGRAAGASPIRGCGRAIASMSAPSSRSRC